MIDPVKLDHVRGTPGSRRRLEAQVWEGARVGADPAEVPDIAEVSVPAPLREAIEHEMAKYPDFHSAVIPALRLAQHEHGWLSPEAMVQVAAVMRVAPAYLESIATFYDMFELDPPGKHVIYVCTNISCSLRGAHDLLSALSEATGAAPNTTSPDGSFRLRTFECLGACDIAPMAAIDGHYRGPLDGDDANAVAEHLRAGRPVEQLLPEKGYDAMYPRRGAERGASEGASS